MADVSIKIENLAEIKAAFSKAPGLMIQELGTAIQRSIFSIQSKSQMNTPVDTGRLRASHESLFGPLRGEVHTNTNYGLFVHDGTKYMKGRPFMLDAVTSENNAVQKNFTEAVDKVLAKIAGDVR